MTLPTDKLIIDKRACLEQFNREHYKESFDEYCTDCAEVFEELTALGDAAGDGAYSLYLDIAGRLIDELEARWASEARNKRLRELLKEKDKTLIAVFLVPAALAYGERCAAFADALCLVWNERYPKDRFHVGTFEDIAAGFSRRIKWFDHG